MFIVRAAALALELLIPAPLFICPIAMPIVGNALPIGMSCAPTPSASPAVGVVRPLEHGLFAPLAGLLRLLAGGTAVLALENAKLGK